MPLRDEILTTIFILFSTWLLIIPLHVYMYSNVLFTVRLVDGPTKYEGRVEVYYNGEWGTVCDDGWDLNNAQVVCRQLGYGKATAAIRYALYGQGSGQIVLDNVNCIGTEQTVGNCSHGGWGLHNCGHYEDASVRCSSGDVISLILIKIMVNYIMYLST